MMIMMMMKRGLEKEEEEEAGLKSRLQGVRAYCLGGKG